MTAAAAPIPGSPVRFLLQIARRRPAMHLGLLALVVGAALCAVGVQYGMKLLIDALSGETRDVPGAWSALGLFMVLIGVECVLWRLAGWLGGNTIVADGIEIRLRLFDYLSGHGAKFFADNLTGALGSRVAAVSTSLANVITSLTWQIAPPLTDFFGALVVLALVDWRLAAALVVFVAIVGGGLTAIGARGSGVHRDYAAEAARSGGEMIDTVANISIVKAFSARRREHARLAARFASEGEAHRRSWHFLEKMRVLHDLCLWLMAGGMLFWVLRLWSSGAATAGDVVIVSALTFRILHGSRDFALALGTMSRELGVIGETLRTLTRPHDVVDRPAAPALRRLGGAVEFDRVSFAYRPGQTVLEDFSLRIPAGQSVGIVGPSGAGKSTLIYLAQRQGDVTGGRILIDGQDIASVTQDSLRAAMAVVPQEIALFHRSVRENIRYARPEASDAEVVAAAEAAYCHDLIEALPEGYDTIVGERGAKLSGGQRQRLAIARAILKDAPIVILDEATSALDTETERDVQRALAALVRGRTVLAVAHRLSTVAGFDRIVVLVDGRIVEDGPPAELRRRGGVFSTMWQMQAEGLDAEDPELVEHLRRPLLAAS